MSADAMRLPLAQMEKNPCESFTGILLFSPGRCDRRWSEVIVT